jgi:prevent-host-death family protein
LAKARRLLTDNVATVAQCELDPAGRLSGTDPIRLGACGLPRIRAVIDEVDGHDTCNIAPSGDGSSSATIVVMATIPQKELRNNVGEVLRRAEAGEEITITVAGRPVAQLGPVMQKRWVSGPALRAIWRTPAPKTLSDDLKRFPASMVDPFE